MELASIRANRNGFQETMAAGLGLMAFAAGCTTTTGGGGGPPANLIGVWQTTFNDPIYGPGSIEFILASSGEFQQQTLYRAGSIVTIYGTYRVFANEALLRLDILAGEPSETCGPLGCSPILYPAGESHSYTLVDNNTLVLQNINCGLDPTACTFTYGRAA